HVIRSKADADRVLSEHASKMHWNFCDVAKIHDHGTELMTPREGLDGCSNGNSTSCQKILAMPLDSSPLPTPRTAPAKPMPPPANGKPDGTPPVTVIPINSRQANTATEGPALPVLSPAEGMAVDPINQGKETQTWSVKRPQ